MSQKRNIGNPKAIKAEINALNRTIAANIKYYRGLHQLTQLDISEILGCTVQQVQKYENNINRISVASLVILARTLSLQPHHFYLPQRSLHPKNTPTEDLTAYLPHLTPEKQTILLNLATELAPL